uniref:Uncharacterized protein n=1 Tax=Fervidicoccus fontis TaxID=683846 RepID=A0A7J3ZIS5_9CREN
MLLPPAHLAVQSLGIAGGTVTRTQELEAGLVLALLGFILTFTVLSILTITLKLTSIAVTHLRRREKEATTTNRIGVAREAPEGRHLPKELIAAAVAGISLYLKEKLERTPPAPKERRVDYWTLSWRMQSSKEPEALEARPWRRHSG